MASFELLFVYVTLVNRGCLLLFEIESNLIKNFFIVKKIMTVVA